MTTSKSKVTCIPATVVYPHIFPSRVEYPCCEENPSPRIVKPSMLHIHALRRMHGYEAPTPRYALGEGSMLADGYGD